MTNLTPNPGWDDVPQLETTTKALGGVGGPMNTQAQALLDRTETLNPDNQTAPAALDGTETWSFKKSGAWAQAKLSAIASFVLTIFAILISSGPGAVARTIVDWMRDQPISAKNFGAKGDNAADDTSALSLAASIPNATIYVPPGTYRVSGQIQLADGTTLKGSGRNATIFNVTSTTKSIFCCFGTRSALRSIGIRSDVTQTAGAFVTLQGSESSIEDFSITNDFNGILMTGNVSKILNGRMQFSAPGAIRIRAEGGDNSQLIDGVLMGAESPANIAAAGIRVRNSSALTISNTSVIQQGTGLLCDPYTFTEGAATDAGSVYSLTVSNVFLDNCTRALDINPTGTGSVVRSRFINTWTSSSSYDGIRLVNGGTGAVSGVYFENHHSVLNVGAGLTTGGSVKDLQYNGGCLSQNAYGAYLNNGAQNVAFNGVTIGAGADLSGNTNAGLVASGGVTNLIAKGNMITGNADAGISIALGATNPIIADNNVTGNGTAISDASTGDKVVCGNVGYNPLPIKLLGITASPYTYTNNTGAPVTLYVAGGTVSSIVVDTLSLVVTADVAATIAPGSSAVITYSAAPNVYQKGIL